MRNSCNSCHSNKEHLGSIVLYDWAQWIKLSFCNRFAMLGCVADVSIVLSPSLCYSGVLGVPEYSEYNLNSTASTRRFG
jgi:hypothetical protein